LIHKISRGSKSLAYQRFKRTSRRSVQRMRKPPASPARRLSMVSASARPSSTVSLDQTSSPEATRPPQRPEAQWKVKLTAHTATIVAPYLNVASDLAVMSNDDSPCVLPFAGMGCGQNICEVIANAHVVHANAIDTVLIADNRLPTSEGYRQIADSVNAFCSLARSRRCRGIRNGKRSISKRR
jgi:hypothetical protein